MQFTPQCSSYYSYATIPICILHAKHYYASSKSFDLFHWIHAISALRKIKQAEKCHLALCKQITHHPAVCFVFSTLLFTPFIHFLRSLGMYWRRITAMQDANGDECKGHLCNSIEAPFPYVHIALSAFNCNEPMHSSCQKLPCANESGAANGWLLRRIQHWRLFITVKNGKLQTWVC